MFTSYHIKYNLLVLICYIRICRDILNTCIRNTEEAEQNVQASSSSGSGSGRGLGKGVWGMIEESGLAKSFKKNGEEQKVSENVSSHLSFPISN